ncbi:MAG: hypothetical protein Q9211_006732, partial [Gyalolechia sp. 1 TL-2023]
MRSSLVFAGFVLSRCAGVLSESKAAINAFKRVDALKPELVEREVDLSYPRRLDKRASPYLTEATQKFVVDGTAIPDVDFDIGESYAGQEFAGFYKQFATTFGLENRKVYLTGESYAGFYVPYIADAFINQNDDVYYNLAGVAINDPIIGDATLQQQG